MRSYSFPHTPQYISPTAFSHISSTHGSIPICPVCREIVLMPRNCYKAKNEFYFKVLRFLKTAKKEFVLIQDAILLKEFVETEYTNLPLTDCFVMPF